jgi:hypothetical protein
MPENLKGALQPKITEKTYVFGNSPLTSLQKVLQEDGQWDNWLPDFELQRDKDWTKSTFGCVSFSNNNSKEILFKRMFGYDINIDDRDLTVLSGTVPEVGNDIISVAECHRKNGLILERTQTMYQEMPVSEYYKWVRDDKAKEEAKMSLELFNFGYELFTRETSSADVSPAKLIEGLKYAPIQVTVDGRYTYDENGYVCRNDIIYSHEVVLIGYVLNPDLSVKYWKVFDSCHNEIVKFCGTYRFGYPLINTLIPKSSMKLYRKKNTAPIYFLNEKEGVLVPYADGKITGGNLFKIFFGEYKYAPIIVVDELPFPVAQYSITTL